MSSVFYQKTIRVVSLTIRVVDDITSGYLTRAKVKIDNALYSRVATPKKDGFHVFTDVPPGSYTLTVEADNYDYYSQSIDIPSSSGVVLDIPGENEVFLSVTSSNTTNETIDFAARNFYTTIESGTLVITARRISSLADPLEGEGVTTAMLDEVGSGPNRIRNRDVVRLIGERLVRLRAAPHYHFSEPLRRLSGTVRDSATDEPVENATVSLSRIGSSTINYEDVGTTPENTVRVYTIGNSTANKRVLGVARDIQKTSNTRGQYLFYFPTRPDLTINQVTVNATASNYASSIPVDVDLTTRTNSIENILLTRL